MFFRSLAWFAFIEYPTDLRTVDQHITKGISYYSSYVQNNLPRSYIKNQGKGLEN